MRWVALILGLPLAAAAVWLACDPRVGTLAAPPGSSLSTAPEGFAVARTWLADHGGATTLHRPPAGLPAEAVLFRLLPTAPAAVGAPGPAPRAAWSHPLSAPDEAFVRRGGRLVLAIAGPWAGLSTVPGAPPAVVLPLLPGVERLGGGTLRGLEARRPASALLANAVTVVAAGERPAVARLALGRGDVWLLGCPELLNNAHLGQLDHLALLAALADGRPAWFDETVHGLAAGPEPLALLREWGLGPLLALLLIAVAAWWWRAARVPGPVQAERRPREAEAVEGIEALAALIGRSSTDQELLAAHRARLSARLARRLHLTPEAADRRLAAAGAVASARTPLATALARLHRAYLGIRHDRP
jgi:hypothetical protein